MSARGVTDRPKCYVSVCASCGGLYDTPRAHALTCGGTRRVRLHRHPELVEPEKSIAAALDIPLAVVFQSRAVAYLRPDLAELIATGTRDIASVQTEVLGAYNRLVLAAAEVAL